MHLESIFWWLSKRLKDLKNKSFLIITQEGQVGQLKHDINLTFIRIKFLKLVILLSPCP